MGDCIVIGDRVGKGGDELVAEGESDGWVGCHDRVEALGGLFQCVEGESEGTDIVRYSVRCGEGIGEVASKC